MKKLNYALYGAIGLGVIAGVYAFWDYTQRNKKGPEIIDPASYAHVSDGGTVIVSKVNPVTGVINALTPQNPSSWTRGTVTI